MFDQVHYNEEVTKYIKNSMNVSFESKTKDLFHAIRRMQ